MTWQLLKEKSRSNQANEGDQDGKRERVVPPGFEQQQEAQKE